MTPENRARLEEIKYNQHGICVAKPLLHEPVIRDFDWLITQLEQTWSELAIARKALKKIYANDYDCNCGLTADYALADMNETSEEV